MRAGRVGGQPRQGITLSVITESSKSRVNGSASAKSTESRSRFSSARCGMFSNTRVAVTLVPSLKSRRVAPAAGLLLAEKIPVSSLPKKTSWDPACAASICPSMISIGLAYPSLLPYTSPFRWSSTKGM